MRDLKTVERSGRGKTPLVVRASLPRVFLSLGLFTEVSLLFCGSYLLAEAILQPLDAGTFSVLGGGLFLALATVLLFYLAWPGRKRSMSRREEPVERFSEARIEPCGEVVQTRGQTNWVTEKKEELLRPMQSRLRRAAVPEGIASQRWRGDGARGRR
jgi:hypothetical protein